MVNAKKNFLKSLWNEKSLPLCCINVHFGCYNNWCVHVLSAVTVRDAEVPRLTSEY